MEKTKRYGVTPKHLIRIRAKYMLKTGEDITWVDFAKLVGVHRVTLARIRIGTRTGDLTTMRKLMDFMHQEGIVAHLSDFELD